MAPGRRYDDLGAGHPMSGMRHGRRGSLTGAQRATIYRGPQDQVCLIRWDTFMDSTIDKLRASLRRALAQATYNIGHGEIIDLQQLRELHVRAKRDPKDLRRVRSTRVRVPGLRKAEIANSLRDVLADFVDPDSDRVGHAFPMGGDGGGYAKGWPTGVMTHSKVSSLNQLGVELLLGAAVLGVDCIADLLAGWAKGEPVRYRTCTVIRLAIDRPLAPLEGVSIAPLPLSTDELPAGLPVSGSIRRSDYLGHSVVCVDTKAVPALFRPHAGSPGDVATGELPPDFTFDDLWSALSLECNAHVDLGHGWRDYRQLSVIARDGAITNPTRLDWPDGYRRSTISQGVTRIELDDSAIQTVSDDRIRKLLVAVRGADARTRMAIARWKRSTARRSSLTDRFIDLRIALEALLLPDGPDRQLSFSLATRGAWWLGRDAPERRRIWKTLRDAYSAASNAVHKGEAKKRGYDTEGLAALLADAQMRCRGGILRVLREGSVEDWTRIILNALESPR